MSKTSRNARRPARPYVGDRLETPLDPLSKAGATIGFVLLALVAGFVIGFAVFLVMNLSTWLTERLWSLSGSFALFPLVVCTIGGIAIGVWTWWSHDQVQPLEKVMADFKQTGSYRTNGAWRPTVSFLLPLVFGGSIGFEAGLTGLIASGCCWIRDQLKSAGLRLTSIADVTIAASMAAIFRTPLAGIAAGSEDVANVDDYDLRRRVKAVLYVASAFGAFAGVRVFSALFGVSGGLPRFEEITATHAECLWAIPCLALAYAMTLLFHAATRVFAELGTRVRSTAKGVIAAPIACGIIMGAVACVFPYVLFPGEAQSEELMNTWTTWTAAALLATAFLKTVITPLCIHMGWVGGEFFPCIFAGVTAGYGLSALTGADPMLMVTVTATAFLAGVLRKPLMVLGVMFLCFPADGIMWMGIAAVVGATIPVPHALLKKSSEE